MTEGESREDGSSFPLQIEGGGVILTLSRDQLYVQLAGMPMQELEDFLSQYRLVPGGEELYGETKSDLDGEAPTTLWLRTGSGEDTARVIAKLRADDRVTTVSPVYHRADRLPQLTGLTFGDDLLARFHPQVSEDEIRRLVSALGTEDVHVMPDEREGPLHQLRLRDPKRQEMFEIVESLRRSPLVRHAGPNWRQLHSPLAAIPNDEHFHQQWNLYRIGAPAGWDITRGSGTITIAIMDTGCNLNHPDLKDQFVPKADRLNLNPLSGEGSDEPNDGGIDGGHGTLCAGVAAAMWNNRIGVAGIAPNCWIMPIRFYRVTQEAVGGKLTEVVHDFTILNIVKAIDWARTHRANVINMSWYTDLVQTDIDIALNNAHAAGLVLIAASGNYSLSDDETEPTAPPLMVYPSTHPKVIAVGATDPDDRHQDAKSKKPDWAGRWESRIGDRLSVAAPTTVWTTTKDGGYSGDFIGTSASAPHVAGFAALLLSVLRRPVNVPPGMQLNDLVRNIMEWTAAKVGEDSYATVPGHPNGTWNKKMGYGRIDMAAALRLARDSYTDDKLERVSRDYAVAVSILLGLISGGPGIVLPQGGPPVPVDPGWTRLQPEARDVLIGLAVTELARAVDDVAARRALQQAGREAIERAARQIGQD